MEKIEYNRDRQLTGYVILERLQASLFSRSTDDNNNTIIHLLRFTFEWSRPYSVVQNQKAGAA